MFPRLGTCIAMIALYTACSPTSEGQPARTGAAGGAPRAAPVQGKDYLILERVRILDEMGFDRPVEAMSVLTPKGWRTQSTVRWRSVNECRGDIVTWQMSSVSPDGEIRFVVLPARTFQASQSAMIHQSLVAASTQGGCAVGAPFTATQYLENLARRELGATSVSDVRTDASQQATLDRTSAQANAVSQQYGTGMRQSGTIVYGALAWPDGTRGLANVGVSVIETPGRDLNGAPIGAATTTVYYQVYVRYPAAREAEALRMFATIVASHRINPAWQQAKDNFLAEVGRMEHAGRMERIRLMGEQAAAYARAQSEAADARMRSWERAQASSDASQSRFIQTIREVETWRDASGSPVELSAGYSFGWSRPDGSILLTNNSLFNPSVELQQNWARMEKVRR